jgi:hypothetical protein
MRCATATVFAAERQPGGFPGFPCRPLGSASNVERDSLSSLAALLDGGACPRAASAAPGSALGAAALVPPAAPKLWSRSVSASRPLGPLGPLEGHVYVAGGAWESGGALGRRRANWGEYAAPYATSRSGGDAEPTASLASLISVAP